MRKTLVRQDKPDSKADGGGEYLTGLMDSTPRRIEWRVKDLVETYQRFNDYLAMIISSSLRMLCTVTCGVAPRKRRSILFQFHFSIMWS